MVMMEGLGVRFAPTAVERRLMMCRRQQVGRRLLERVMLIGWAVYSTPLYHAYLSTVDREQRRRNEQGDEQDEEVLVERT